MSTKKLIHSEEISTVWRKTRLGMDLSQIDFAEMLSVTGSYISEIEAGRKKPSDQLAKLFKLITKNASVGMPNSPQPDSEGHDTGPIKQLKYILENGSDSDKEAILGKLARISGEVRALSKKDSQSEAG
jgi:transcriptional regulator with XRE-family HTH domain